MPAYLWLTLPQVDVALTPLHSSQVPDVKLAASSLIRSAG